MTRRRRDTLRDTSLEAWLQHNGSDTARILCFLRDQGAHGATDEETETALGLSHQAVSGDRRHMVQRNEVHDSGEKRPTQSGRRAIVWRFGPSPAQVDGDGQFKLAV